MNKPDRKIILRGINPDTHKKIKLYAVEHDKTLGEAYTEALEFFLRNRK